jgi:hypothetical protein
MRTNNYCVYALVNPEKIGVYKYGSYIFSCEPFYIGKGLVNRPHQHFQKGHQKQDRNKYKTNKLNKILKKYKKDDCLKIIKTNLTENKATRTEINLIGLIKRKPHGPLTNMTNGGEGASGKPPWNKGIKCPQISEKLKGKWAWNKGKKLEEIFDDKTLKKIKTKMSKNRKGKPNPMKGKPNPQTSMRMTMEFTTEEKDFIITEYLSGKRVVDVVESFNKKFNKNFKTRHIIRRVLKEKNIKLRNQYQTKLERYKEIHPQILQLRREGKSLESIRQYCVALGYKMNTNSYIRNVLKRSVI